MTFGFDCKKLLFRAANSRLRAALLSRAQFRHPLKRNIQISKIIRAAALSDVPSSGQSYFDREDILEARSSHARSVHHGKMVECRILEKPLLFGQKKIGIVCDREFSHLLLPGFEHRSRLNADVETAFLWRQPGGACGFQIARRRP